jgi:hypothetical protein
MHTPTYLNGVWGVYVFECFGSFVFFNYPYRGIDMFTATTLKSIKRVMVSAKYTVIKLKTVGEIIRSINSKNTSLPSVCISPAGYPIERLDIPTFFFPRGEAWYMMPGHAERAILLSNGLLACPSVIPFIISHEEGHLAQMAFEGLDGQTLESSELLADQWAIARCSKEECVAMIAYLSLYNMLVAIFEPSVEAIGVNSARIKVLKDFVYG